MVKPFSLAAAGTRLLLLLASMAALALVPAAARAASISGLVLDQERKQPVPQAVVYIDETARGETDAGGRFRLDGLPEGAAVLRIEHIGFESWSRRIRLKEAAVVELTIRVRPRVQTLETVEVGGRRPDPSVPQGKETVTPMQIRRAAGAVATDPLRVVQALPGSAAAGDDFSDRYVVRGGDPEENTVLFDGYPVLRPVHFEGFTSVIYDDLIGGIDFFPGALPSRYGDALSSVTSLGAAVPERGTRFFRYDLGSIALGGQVARGALNAIGAARTSFYNLIVRRPPGVDKRSFQDLAGKGTWTRGGIETCVTAIGSRDRESGDVTRSADDYLLGIRTGGIAAGREWHVSASMTDSKGTASYVRSRSEPREESTADFRRAAAGFDVTVRRGPDLLARIDAEGRNDRFAGLANVYSSPAGFVSAEGTWSGALAAVSAGGRIEKIAFTKGAPLSPYASLRLRAIGRLVPGIAWRVVRQTPFSLTEAPTVAGLPLDTDLVLRTGRDRLEPLRADHVSGTCDVSLGRGLIAGVEAYRKEYSRLLTWPSDAPADIRADGTGIGKGAGLSIRRDGPGARMEISYTVSRTRKREGPALEMRPADYDQPQMLQASLDVPVHGGTSLSFGYRGASGRPYTPLDVVNETIVPGTVNSERLPWYGRLDAKIEHRTTNEKTSAFLYLDVLNLTNRRNVVDIVQFKGAGGRIVRIPTQGIRILPVAGFGFYF